MVVTVDPTQAVRYGIWRMLRADADLMSVAADVVDDEPDRRNYPLVIVPDPISIPENTHDNPGRQVTVRVHTWTRGHVRAENTRDENTIGARIVALLDHQHQALDPYVEGHTVWMVRHQETRHVPEADRSMRHRIDRVSVWTSQE